MSELSDTELLDDLLESGKLTEEQEEAFSEMRDNLTKGKYPRLTPKQRSWAESLHVKLGGDPGTANLASSGKVKVTKAEKDSLQTFLSSLGPKLTKPPGVKTK